MARRRSREPESISADLEHLYTAMNGESPIACALVSVAYIEDALMSLLQKVFIKGETTKSLFSEGGTLGQVSHCNRIAYCLSLIPKAMFENINHIASIRNIFAHNTKLTTFGSPEIRDLCSKLTLPKVTVLKVKGTDESEPGFESICEKDARSRFVYVSHMVTIRLLLNALGTPQKAKVEKDGWC